MPEPDEPSRFLAFEERGFILVTIATPKMLRVIIDILTVLLREEHKSGIVISVDRPHSYLARLLEKRGVPQDNLTYIDTVIGISGEALGSESNLVQLASPFCMSILSNVFSTGLYDKKDTYPGFIVVDNVGALKSFVSDSCIERFLKELNDVKEMMAGGKCIIVMDKTAHPDLYEMIKKSDVREVAL